MENSAAVSNAEIGYIAGPGAWSSAIARGRDYQGMLGAFQTIHYRLELLFDTYNRGSDEQNANAQAVAVHGICEAMGSYLALQVRAFYPVFRSVIEDGDLIVEVMGGIASMQLLIARIERTFLTDAGIPAQIHELDELIRYHIQLEESLIFPRLVETALSRDGDLAAEFATCASQLAFYCSAAAKEPRVAAPRSARAVRREPPGIGASVN
jgi:hypothetical protein